MKNPLFVLLGLLICIAITTGHSSAMSNSAVTPQSGSGNTVFLPLVTSLTFDQYNVRVNIPYFSDNAANHFSEAAIFWFGRVSPSENYADIRFAYDNSKLYVYISTFDQYMWYTPNPASSSLTNWDSATLQINLNGNVGSNPTANTYKFDAAMSWFESRSGLPGCLPLAKRAVG